MNALGTIKTKRYSILSPSPLPVPGVSGAAKILVYQQTGDADESEAIDGSRSSLADSNFFREPVSIFN